MYIKSEIVATLLCIYNHKKSPCQLVCIENGPRCVLLVKLFVMNTLPVQMVPFTGRLFGSTSIIMVTNLVHLCHEPHYRSFNHSHAFYILFHFSTYLPYLINQRRMNTSHPYIPSDEILFPQPNDVIFGRGKGNYNHIGNINFLRFINLHQVRVKYPNFI